ncbi:malate dehydrogenase [Candidatus Saganbacteria bacterium]|nr:malate dehydrogenase [Candidatus Saganbacteria bacterium]
MKPKISVVGAGNVGAQCAFRLAQRNIPEIVLLDLVPGLAAGKALDMSQTGAIDGFASNIIGTTDYQETKNSNVAVITAGLARKPGMSRDDLISKNAAIISDVVQNVIKHSPNIILLIVTNPLDVMTYHALKLSGLPKNRVLGMAPLLDAARMQYFISQMANAHLKEVYAEVMGSHGDLMLPISRLSTVQGKPLTAVLSAEQIKQIEERTTNGGAEIVNLLKTGSAFYAPGSAAAKMAAAIVNDTKEVINSCCYLEGQYGITDVCIGVPAKLGRQGVAEIKELILSDAEIATLRKAAAAVKELCGKL